jgi:hypothetical protein
MLLTLRESFFIMQEEQDGIYGFFYSPASVDIYDSFLCLA